MRRSPSSGFLATNPPPPLCTVVITTGIASLFFSDFISKRADSIGKGGAGEGEGTISSRLSQSTLVGFGSGGGDLITKLFPSFSTNRSRQHQAITQIDIHTSTLTFNTPLISVSGCDIK